MGPGDIYELRVTDKEGRSIPWKHPCIILSPMVREHYFVCAITGSFDLPLDRFAIRMPWAPDGHPVTGLDKECVAKADWHKWVPESLFKFRRGKLSDDVFLAVFYKVEEHMKLEEQARANQLPPKQS